MKPIAEEITIEEAAALLGESIAYTETLVQISDSIMPLLRPTGVYVRSAEILAFKERKYQRDHRKDAAMVAEAREWLKRQGKSE